MGYAKTLEKSSNLHSPTPAKKRRTTRKTGRKNKLSQLLSYKEGFVTSHDKTKIWYQSSGEGIPLIFCNGLGCSTFYWKHVAPHFQKIAGVQVILFDWRAHGKSGKPKNEENMTIDDLCKDLQAVMKKLKIKKAVLAGHSMGTQILYHFYSLHPNKVAGLIPCFGTFQNPVDTFYNLPLFKYIFEGIYIFNHLFPKVSNGIGKIMRSNPFSYQIGGLLKMLNPGLADKQVIKEYLDHITSVDPVLLSKLTRSLQEHTAEPLLKKIKVPTLIFAADQDQFTPVWLSKKMHRLIPKSELLVIKKASHVALIEQPELINLRIEKFLRERLKQDI